MHRFGVRLARSMMLPNYARRFLQEPNPSSASPSAYRLSKSEQEAAQKQFEEKLASAGWQAVRFENDQTRANKWDDWLRPAVLGLSAVVMLVLFCRGLLSLFRGQESDRRR